MSAPPPLACPPGNGTRTRPPRPGTPGDAPEYGQTILVPVTVENKAEAPVESIGWIDLGVTGPSDDDDAGDLLLFSQQLGKRVDPGPGKRADFYIPLRYVGDGDYRIEFEPANTALTLHVEK